MECLYSFHLLFSKFIRLVTGWWTNVCCRLMNIIGYFVCLKNTTLAAGKLKKEKEWLWWLYLFSALLPSGSLEASLLFLFKNSRRLIVLMPIKRRIRMTSRSPPAPALLQPSTLPVAFLPKVWQPKAQSSGWRLLASRNNGKLINTTMYVTQMRGCTFLSDFFIAKMQLMVTKSAPTTTRMTKKAT